MPIPLFDPGPVLIERIAALERQIVELTQSYEAFYYPPAGWEAQYSYYLAIGYSRAQALMQVFRDIANQPTYGYGGGGG